jgi:1-acyl-sn-glycerol-3-phosphate acyltransferase
MTVVAGPKVYSSTRRRFSSLCFGTIRVPQSSARSSEDAVMNPREVARGARRSIAIAHGRLRLGDALLVFAEGARSRTPEMQPLLAAASRYLDLPGTWVLPAGITGTEAMFPVGEDRLYPSNIIARLGPPLPADDLRARAAGNRRLTMDAIGLAIAALLPPAYQGVYGRDADFGEARQVLAAVDATRFT